MRAAEIFVIDTCMCQGVNAILQVFILYNYIT